MVNITVFDTHHIHYEMWFERHRSQFYSQLLSIRAMLPWEGLGLEIGVGSGRFAQPLGIEFGLDPSLVMLDYTVGRNIKSIQGIAEALPFKGMTFDFALIVNTISFVEDINTMLKETYRVLKKNGTLIIGFIDSSSAVGCQYLNQDLISPFYQEAKFHSACYLEECLRNAGFKHFRWGQTLCANLEELCDIDSILPMRIRSREGVKISNGQWVNTRPGWFRSVYDV